jgi:acetyl esterase
MSRRDALRRQLGGAALEQLFLRASQSAKLHPRLRALLREVTLTADLAYLPTGLPEHRLDLYRPREATGPLPTIFFIHGGGFRILSKDTHWLMGVLFARAGYQVFSINYRLAPRHPWPAAPEDTHRALAWVLRHGEALGADLRRLAFAGESAGANLATGLALSTARPLPQPWARAIFDAAPRLRAVVAACGLLQVSDIARFHRRRPLRAFVNDRLHEIERQYLPEGAPADPDARALADPLLALEDRAPLARPLPPFFIPVGTRDPILDDSRRLEQALKARDTQAELVIYPGEVHAFHAFLWRPAAQRCWRDKLSFLSRHL